MDQRRQAGGEDDAAELHHFRSNEVRLWLSVLAYSLGDLWRRLVKIGGRPIKHARYYRLLLAESHLIGRPGSQNGNSGLRRLVCANGANTWEWKARVGQVDNKSDSRRKKKASRYECLEAFEERNL